VAGLVPAAALRSLCALTIGVAGTSPATTGGYVIRSDHPYYRADSAR